MDPLDADELPLDLDSTAQDGAPDGNDDLGDGVSPIIDRADELADAPDFIQQTRSFAPRRRSTGREGDDWMEGDGDGRGRLGFGVAWPCVACAVAVVAICIALGFLYLTPQPLQCSVRQVHAQRFKVDVTDFWSPRLSSTLQLVLSVRNPNLLASMLLEECHVTVFERVTGLKLGAATHGRLHVEPMRSVQVNLAVKQPGGSLPPPEQRRLAEMFLRHKALLLTFVATATSKIPLKTAKSSQVTANTTKRVDLSTMAKDPFYTRPPPSPRKEPEGPVVHDVPI